jgi:hypothetical protein
MYPFFEKFLSILFITVFFIYVNAHLIINRIVHLFHRKKYLIVK